MELKSSVPVAAPRSIHHGPFETRDFRSFRIGDFPFSGKTSFTRSRVIEKHRMNKMAQMSPITIMEYCHASA